MLPCLNLSEGKIPIYIALWERVGNAVTTNVGENRMNLGIKVLLVQSVNGTLGGRMSRWGQDTTLSLEWETIL